MLRAAAGALCFSCVYTAHVYSIVTVFPCPSSRQCLWAANFANHILAGEFCRWLAVEDSAIARCLLHRAIVPAAKGALVRHATHWNAIFAA